uniref:Uncharacterized protein n=1 Tax=Siphoviridae sp. ctcUB23 TaxID=2825573 RepID=A0A8S5PJZ7_9CAUD|nr:MAG TPA: hypothetical protein [Siphoviridae sp. ctcUB23]DAW35255.1 MAG TPA: hypothetical protein [Caudoviricetes sp.]
MACNQRHPARLPPGDQLRRYVVRFPPQEE